VKKLIIIILLTISFSSNTLFAKGKISYVKIIKENKQISAEIKNANIEEIFKQISEKFGIGYKIFREMRNKIITVTFEKTSLQEGIKKIVQKNYLLAFNNNGKVTKVYILNKGDRVLQYRNKMVESFLDNEPLSLDRSKEVVTHNVLKEHPSARLYEIIPHYDLNKKLVSYVFTYYIGEKKVPDRETLKRDIKRAWKEKKKALEEIQTGYAKRDSSQISKAAVLSKRASLNMTRENDFVSLEIGANYETPPIIAVWHGLPLDISLYPRALDITDKRLKNKAPVFKNTYTTGFFTIVFAFEGNDKRTYYIEPDTQKVFTSSKQIKKQKEEDIQKRETNIKERNKSKWADFLDI